MELILVSSSRGNIGRLPLNRPLVLVAAALCTFIVALAARACYETAVDVAAARLLDDEGSTAALLQREVVTRQQEVERLDADVTRNLDALASRLGRLQAHVTRLDALGERLTRLSGLSLSEFDFGTDPAIGGPVPPDPASSQGAIEIAEDIERIAAAIGDQQDKLAGLETLLMSARLQDAVEPAGRPIREGWMSSGFGRRSDPVTGKREFHRGIDFAGRMGSDVIAVAAGVVTWSARRAGHGNMIEINHGNGLVTRYSHNKRNLVEVGDKVAKNQVIANMGSTGRSTGPHVHFEVIRDGKFVNPITYIRAAAD